MHLKKLELQGFKSFPEYTLIEFDNYVDIYFSNGNGQEHIYLIYANSGFTASRNLN